MHGFKTPLRYPGGKGQLANFFKLVLVENKIVDGHYVEVYAGGAAVAMTLLLDEYVTHVHINDVNDSVHAFWSSLLDSTDDLCKRIHDTPVTMDVWKQQREIQRNPSQHSKLDLGFSTFFLNRTNRSGIIHAGVIGGKGQTGTWKIDARFNKKDLVSRIENIARYRSRVSLYNQDAAWFIATTLPQVPSNALVYLDPPYFAKGQELYQNHYEPRDHKKIAKLVTKSIAQNWIVSYDNVESINTLYKEHPSWKYDLSYSAQTRYSGNEVMFFSKKLRVPNVVSPAIVRLPAVGRPML
jgi:DNA adenine methylase